MICDECGSIVELVECECPVEEVPLSIMELATAEMFMLHYRPGPIVIARLLPCNHTIVKTNPSYPQRNIR